MWGLQATGFTAAELERFRHFQRLSYDVLERVFASLREGETERDVGRRIHLALKAAGAQNYFHAAVALFGDRTAYPGEFGQFEALPTDRRLRPGDAVILDVAPIFDGFTVDTSYASCFEGDGVPRVLDEMLAELRAAIPGWVKQGLTMREITRRVDARIRESGLENCHRKHIGQVLGHRVTKEVSPRQRSIRLWGINPRQATWFILRSALSSLGNPRLSPNWNAAPQSDRPVPDGLWAVEPHVARGAFGAKFEELLVVQGGDAYYLDEQLPHQRRWSSANLTLPARCG